MTFRTLTVALTCPCGRHATGFESSVITCVGCGALFVVGVLAIDRPAPVAASVSPTEEPQCSAEPA